ncbi:MAG: helix-turn-helix domain-containing protein, partial [Dethiobacteria bacterium]|nr:helix-turn-helix domain-containing protein [Dethiobacteria bacterium]
LDKKQKGLSVPYFQVPNDVFEIRLTTSELIVYIYLFRCSNQGKTAFPSYETIGKKTGLSRRSAIYTVKKLVNRGVVLKRSQGRGKSNLFEVILPGSATITPVSATITPEAVHSVHPIKNKCIKNKYEEKTGSTVFDCRLRFEDYCSGSTIDEKSRRIMEYILDHFRDQIGLQEQLTR